MTFEHVPPGWALLIILAACAAIAWLAYRHAPLMPARRLALVSLRFATLVLLVVLLMRPVARVTAEDADAVVPILVDTSRSMSIDEGEGRRLDRARQLLQEDVLPALAGRFRVELLAFGEGLSPVTPEQLQASARQSDLAGALRAVVDRYRDQAVPGIVLLSDGGDSSGTLSTDLPDLPAVYALGIGAPAIAGDQEVLSVTAAEAVLDDSRVELAVSAVGRSGQRPLELRVLENGRPIDVRIVQPAGDGVPVREVFVVEPPGGAATVYSVQAPIRSDDPVPENNARSVLVQPPSRARRVLLVQGAPGYEHSFLRRSWRRDPGLEVDTVVRQGRNEQGEDTFYIQADAGRGARLAAGYPTRAEDLFAYDAVVLANVEAGLLSAPQLEATRAFVARRGGGLLVLGARSFLRQGLADTPLAEVLPLDVAGPDRGAEHASAGELRGRNRVTLTREGEAHPMMQLGAAREDTRRRWEAIPPLAAVATLRGPRAGASILAVTGGPGGMQRPLVAVQRFGDGRAMTFAGEASWRWRMLLPADDPSFDTFWRQALRWLALPAPDPVAISLPGGMAPGDLVPLRVAVRNAAFEALPNAAVEFRVTMPDGRVEWLPAAPDPDDPGRGTFTARYRPEIAGVYRVAAEVRPRGMPPVDTSIAMLVGGADVEMSNPALNLPLLQRLAAATGGKVLAAGDLAELPDALRDAVPAARAVVRRDLWHNGLSFALVLGLLSAEWLTRRRWGLR